MWLRCDLPTLVRRVSGRGHRPLLEGGDPAEILRRLMTSRHPVYAEAELVVECDDDSQDATTDRVEAALQGWRPPRRLPVALETASYEVVIGDGLLARAGAWLAPVLPQKRVVVVTDALVGRLYLPALLGGLAATGIDARAITVPQGEASKSLDRYGQVVDELLDGGGTAYRRAGAGRRRWWGTWPVSPPPPRCAACPSCNCPPRCWRRWIPRLAARPASTRGTAKTCSAPSTSR